MRVMLRPWMSVFLICALALPSTSQNRNQNRPAPAPAAWSSSFSQTMEASKKSGKLVFAFFTGSDWCGPCKEFTRTILSTSTFRNWARTNVHLLEVDFPERKAQSDMIKRQNEALANTYRVTGFPTVLLITPDRKTYARLSISSRTTPQTFVDNLNQLVKRYNQDRRIRR